MPEARLSAAVLGKLLVAMQTLEILPDIQSMASFLQSALGEVPGVGGVFLCHEGAVLPAGRTAPAMGDLRCAKAASPGSAPACGLMDRPEVHLVTLGTPRGTLGCMVILVQDEARFRDYEPFLVNIAHLVATILEGREDVRALAEVNEHLSGIVAELDQARTTAQADRAHLRAAVDSLLDPHVLVEAVRDQAGQVVDFVFTDANPAAGVHYRRACPDLIGARLLDLHRGQGGTDLRASFRRVVETGEPLVLDDAAFDQALPDGAEHRFDVRGARVGDGLSYTWRDVTSRHQAEERRAQFLSHVSHELRSPLAVVHQFGSLLVDGVGGPVTDDQQEFLAVMMRNVGQLKAMIDELLEVTRSESGRLTIDPRTLGLGDLLTDAIAAARVAANERDVTLVLEHRDLPPVFADPQRMWEVLANLLENALKFTPAGGQITVSAVLRDAEVHVSVRDTGRGISPENQGHVFEQFFQVDHDGQESRNGLGLGLYLCRDLIERQGGRIWVAGDLGAGTTMTFTIPVDTHHTQRVPVVTG